MMKGICIIFFIFILELTLPIDLSAQNRWTQTYFPNEDAFGNSISLAYDNGFLMIGNDGFNNANYYWIIKSDVNGEILWKKTIGSLSSNIVIQELANTDQGDFYLGGLTKYNQDDYDPLIMKLNSCGEKQWCRVFQSEGINHVSALEVTQNGDVVVVLIQMSTIPFTDDICLAKFDTNGNLLWKHCYNSSDTSLFDSNARDLTLAPDGGFLITGYCSYEDPNPPHYWWWKPYYIKVDSIGNFEWEVILHKEVSDIGGEGWTTVLNPAQTFYYSSIYHNYHNSGDAATLVKIDLSGNIVGIYDLASPDNSGLLFDAKFIIDNSMVASAVWGHGYMEAVIIDTLGDIMSNTELLNNYYFAHTEVTHDSKLLFFTNQQAVNGNFNPYLFKFNQQLQSDTNYNQIFTYDSLCPYQIVSDTIAHDDCEVIVSNKYLTYSSSTGQLKIFPNPAKESFMVQVKGIKQQVSSIEVYNSYGQPVHSPDVYKTETGIIVNCSDWNSGVYVVRVLYKDGSQGSGRVVVVH